MEYIVTGNEMKLLDDTTSQVFLVPSVVLMEQAAAGVVRELVACFDKSKEFAVICGRGTVSYTHLDVYKRQGRNESSYIKCYKSLIALSSRPNRPDITIEMPPGSEELDLSLIHI